MSGIVDSLFGGMMGGGGKAQKVDWKQLEKMMDYSARLNRYNESGPFGGTEWTENPDGTWQRSHVVNEALQGGVDEIMQRIGAGPQESTPFGFGDNFNALREAQMQQQMARHGISDQYQPPQAEAPPQAGQLPADPGAAVQPMPAQQPQGGPPQGGPPQGQVPPQAQEQMAQALMQQQGPQGIRPPTPAEDVDWQQIQSMMR